MFKNTIIIWDQCGENPITFFWTEGDYSKLAGTYINSGEDEDKEEALNVLLAWDKGSGEPTLETFEYFPHNKYKAGETAIIVCGFVP